MKEDLTLITFLLDSSGSMGRIKQATIEGFNAFLEDQKRQPGQALFSLVEFNDHSSQKDWFKNIQEAAALDVFNFQTRGGTALLDALEQTIDHTGGSLYGLPEEARPAKVIFVIITDGEENSSRRATYAQVADKISHQQDVYNWQFIYLGANQDAIATASKLNIDRGAALTYWANDSSAKAVYSVASSNLSSRRSGISPQSASFTEAERKKVENA